MTATTWPMVRAWLERRAEFAHATARALPVRKYVAIQLNTGRVEVYADCDGLEMFQGYADDGTLGAPLVVAALGALAAIAGEPALRGGGLGS